MNKKLLVIILFLTTRCFAAVGDREFAADVNIAGDLTVVGDVDATAFTGNGSALTGITGATGGISNTGSTTIEADSDGDASGVIAFQINSVTMLEVTNAGNLDITNAVTSGIWNGTAIDISDYTNLVAGTNITLSGDTLNVDDVFLVNNADDTTSGVITSAGFTITTGNALTLGTTQWDDGSDKIEGNVLADDSVDDDALDFTSITLADFTCDIASTDLTDTADLLYETELDSFSELQTQISDKTLLNEEDTATIDSAWTFSGGITASVTGNTSTATALQTGRTIGLTGDITAAGVSFDGTANIELATVYAAGSIVNADIDNSAAISADKLTDGSANAIPTLVQETNWDTHLSSDGSDHTFIDQSVVSGSSPDFDNTNMTGNISVWTNDSGYLTSLDAGTNLTLSGTTLNVDDPVIADLTGDVTGNADTATILATGRTIGMTGDVVWTSPAFDGSGNITASSVIQADSVALGTDTTGNYVAAIADAGSSTMTVVGSGSENASVTLDVADNGLTNAHFTHSTDWGDVKTDASGDVVLDDDTVAVAEFLASQDWGDMSTAADGTVSLDDDVVSTDEMADADHGDFTYSNGSATLDTDSVADNEIDYTTVTLADFTCDIASTDLTDTADLLYETELDSFSELQTQISDKTLLNEEDTATIDVPWSLMSGTVISDSNDGGNVSLTLRNTAGVGSTDETVTIQAQHTTDNKPGGKLVFGRIGSYGIPGSRDSFMDFYTTLNGTDTLAFRIDENQDVDLQANDFVTTGTGTFGNLLTTTAKVGTKANYVLYPTEADHELYLMSDPTNFKGAYLSVSSATRATAPGEMHLTYGDLTAAMPAGARLVVRRASDSVLTEVLEINADGETEPIILNPGIMGFSRGAIPPELTISSGSITPTASFHVVDTEDDDPSDEVTDLLGTNFAYGDILILAAANDARTIVVKDNNGTGSSIYMGGADFSLDNDKDRLVLQNAGGDQWVKLFSSDNGS